MTLRQLDYAPQPVPWHRRRSVRQTVLGILLAAAVVVFLVGGRAAWLRYQQHRAWVDLLARQQRCMSYMAAPNLVVCEEDPRKFSGLLASNPNYLQLPDGGPDDRPFVGFVPTVLHQFPQADFRDDLPVLFLHSRRLPNGTTRLVGSWVRGIGSRECMLVAQSDNPATRNGFVGFGLQNIFFNRGPHDYLTITAGQPDPADPSHFTIGYKFADQPGTIDGWLTDGGGVKMQVRDGPATYTTTSSHRHPASEPFAN